MIWGGRNTETGLTARDEFRKYWKETKEELRKL
jgi:preprotein translocase subunit SecE